MQDKEVQVSGDRRVKVAAPMCFRELTDFATSSTPGLLLGVNLDVSLALPKSLVFLAP